MRPNSRKTHCPHGHAYDEANTYYDKSGNRRCRACNKNAFKTRNQPKGIKSISKPAVKLNVSNKRCTKCLILLFEGLQCSITGCPKEQEQGVKRRHAKRGINGIVKTQGKAAYHRVWRRLPEVKKERNDYQRRWLKDNPDKSAHHNELARKRSRAHPRRVALVETPEALVEWRAKRQRWAATYRKKKRELQQMIDKLQASKLSSEPCEQAVANKRVVLTNATSVVSCQSGLQLATD